MGGPLGALIKYLHDDELALGLSMQEVLDECERCAVVKHSLLDLICPFGCRPPIESNVIGVASDVAGNSARISRELRDAMTIRDLARIRQLVAAQSKPDDDDMTGEEKLVGEISPGWSDDEMMVKPQTKTLQECEHLFSIFEMSGTIENDFVPFAMTELSVSS